MLVGAALAMLVSAPAWADDPSIPHDFRHDTHPVAREVLEHLRAGGLPQEVHAPRGEIAVILWDEPKTPRPGGSKGTSAVGTSIQAVSITDIRRR